MTCTARLRRWWMLKHYLYFYKEETEVHRSHLVLPHVDGHWVVEPEFKARVPTSESGPGFPNRGAAYIWGHTIFITKGCPMNHRMFSRIPDLYPPNVSNKASLPEVMTVKNASDIANHPPSKKNSHIPSDSHSACLLSRVIFRLINYLYIYSIWQSY